MKFKIGYGSSVHLGCKFTAIKCFSMGKNSTFNQYCRIDNRAGIYVDDNVSISPHVNLITADHDLNASNFEARQKPIILKNYVFVGSDAMILPGVVMEVGSALGAKSLLRKSTIAYGIYVGLPAELKANRQTNLTYNSTYIRWFH